MIYLFEKQVKMSLFSKEQADKMTVAGYD